MKDAELDRKVAANWREFLKEAGDMRDVFIWVWQEFNNTESRRQAKQMFFIMLFSLIFSAVAPWTLGLVFNGLAAADRKLNLIIIGLISYALLILVIRFLRYLGWRNREILLGEISRELDKRTTELFFEKSLGKHTEENTLLSEATLKKGHERIIQLNLLIAHEGMEAVLSLVITFAALWLLGWEYGLVMSSMFGLYLAWSFYLNRRVLIETLPFERQWRNLNYFRLERIDSIERVKTNHKEESEVREIGDRFERIIQPDRKFWLWFIAQGSLRGLVNYFFQISLMIYGVYQVWQGEMAIGLLYPLYSWINLLVDNLWRIGTLEHQINFATPSILAMKEALTMPSGLTVAEETIPILDDSPGKVEFRNVNFAYPASKRKRGTCQAVPVLNDVSFTIESGEKVALLGMSGAGKTTIMHLLLRYMDPTDGQILVDGHDLRELEIGSWLKRLGYVAQQPQIFDGSIRYNLLYGLSAEEQAQISETDLNETARLLRIDFGKRLTHGLETIVGRRGIKLSGGQSQRVMLGAAALKKPSLMVIDEATSSLDSTTEKQVQDGLKTVLTADMSALIITHRLSTVRRICNKFILVDGNGGEGSKVLAAAGSFEELADKSPAFRSLAADQDIFI